MEQYFPLLRSTALFRDIEPDGLRQLIECFQPQIRHFPKGSFLLLSGFENHQIGVILEGEADGLKNTPDGSEVIITHLRAGGVFGDVLSGSSLKSPVSILARTDCRVIFFPYEKVIHPCHTLHYCHNRLMQNLVAAISEKYFALDRRVDLLILKSLRAKLSAWLLEQAEQNGSDTFTTEMTRSALAKYLNCERSALSRELNRMQAEGLIQLYRSSFKILDKQTLVVQTGHERRPYHA